MEISINITIIIISSSSSNSSNIINLLRKVHQLAQRCYYRRRWWRVGTPSDTGSMCVLYRLDLGDETVVALQEDSLLVGEVLRGD